VASVSVNVTNFNCLGIIDSPVDSLFTYKPGETWSTFYEPYFVPIYQPVFSDSTLQQQATEVCGSDLECFFDMAATGRQDIGQVSVEVEQEIEEILELQVTGNIIKANSFPGLH